MVSEEALALRPLAVSLMPPGTFERVLGLDAGVMGEEPMVSRASTSRATALSTVRDDEGAEDFLLELATHRVDNGSL